MRWISVSDSMPEHGEYVDVWSLGERITDAVYRDNGFYLDLFSPFEYQAAIDGVTHWMKIDPPREAE